MKIDIYMAESLRRINNNGMAIRAAMGKTKVAFNTNRRVNVTIADWTVLEEDDLNHAIMAIGGTTIPASDIPT